MFVVAKYVTWSASTSHSLTQISIEKPERIIFFHFLAYFNTHFIEKWNPLKKFEFQPFFAALQHSSPNPIKKD
jgi:hypothetical protein